MEVGSPEWIEASLAKLEQLEQQRATHERAIETVKEPMALRRHTDALSRLDAEVKALYAQLESFAEDDEEEEQEAAEEAQESAVAETRTAGDETLSAPHSAAMAMPMTMATPLAAPISHAVPFTSPPASVSAPPISSAALDDDEPKGGAGKWIVIGLLLVGGLGVGGFFMMQKNKAADTPAQGSGGSVEIKASEIPDDTEAPKAAKGADVDRTPVENAGGGTGGSSGTGGSKKDTKKDTKKEIKLNVGDDPLG